MAKKKPLMGGAMGGAVIGLGGSGLMLASQLGNSAINAGAAVGGAAIGADVLKELFKNPMALAAVGGVLTLFLLK